jgi:hypothetical protein
MIKPFCKEGLCYFVTIVPPLIWLYLRRTLVRPVILALVRVSRTRL